MTSRFDPLAALAAAVALLTTGLYLGIISRQGGDGVVWFPAGLLVAAALAGYGTARGAPGRRGALAVAGLLLLPLGLLGLLTIGLPVLAAAALALVAAVRHPAVTRANPRG